MTSNKGRKPKEIDEEKLELLLSLDVPKTKIAEHLGVSRATLYRILDKRKI